MTSALIERRYKWPMRFFHTFGALGNQAQAPVKPRKGRQNQGGFARRNLILSPRWGSREPEGFLDPGLGALG